MMRNDAELSGLARNHSNLAFLCSVCGHCGTAAGVASVLAPYQQITNEFVLVEIVAQRGWNNQYKHVGLNRAEIDLERMSCLAQNSDLNLGKSLGECPRRAVVSAVHDAGKHVLEGRKRAGSEHAGLSRQENQGAEFATHAHAPDASHHPASCERGALGQ
jgi:hypothetical protein